jgi:hypothetical protein
MRTRSAAYKSGMRPYGQPATGFRNATPRPQTVGYSRKVTQVANTSTHTIQPVEAKPTLCAATKKNGEPCKGRPVGDSEHCSFHRV